MPPEPLHIPFPHPAGHLYCLLWAPFKQLVLSDVTYTFISTGIQKSEKSGCLWLKGSHRSSHYSPSELINIRSLAVTRRYIFTWSMCLLWHSKTLHTCPTMKNMAEISSAHQTSLSHHRNSYWCNHLPLVIWYHILRPEREILSQKANVHQYLEKGRGTQHC